jgi:hypothetical protein
VMSGISIALLPKREKEANEAFQLPPSRGTGA